MKWSNWLFVAIMLLLMAVFIALGFWQVERLGEKQALIAAVEERYTSEPVAFPPAQDWASLDPADLIFQPVEITGQYLPGQSVRIFTSLASTTARGAASGPGYWVVTPFALQQGGTVFVNRGFVPDALIDDYMTAESLPAGEVTIEGVLRAPEAASLFTPEPDPERRLAWVRDPGQLAALAEDDLSPIAPMTLDLAAGPEGTLPQGGETVIEFPNNHLGYAMTWFGFALITPFLLGAWLWRQRKTSNA
ncbi:SURF1-like protein [Devosia pacifica]|uniref:SURF1-like protein n=1 Tax=Devosia pacifica TaxID=1335967 RepID=A0A918VWT5_9HYPH|nr:SURF1 family protein [Devosia pacifica]GHA30573.1 SURF1-like protein [Devosia pacifica]